MEAIEILILKALVFNNEYLRKILPFLKSEYFSDLSQRIIFEEINKFANEYNENPTKEILCIEIQKRKDVTESEFKDIIQTVKSFKDTVIEFEWLVNTTEKWCKERATYIALMESIQIFDGNDKTRGTDAIPSLLQDALSVGFDSNVGHDYINNAEERYEFYHRKEEKIEFDLEMFNKITKGGISNKTLTIALAGTGVGKSLFMCHFASSVLLQGRNVLYITLEMGEEKIAERIDANLLNVNIQNIVDMTKSTFNKKINALAQKTQGNLIIKEYPTSSAHSGHFRSLLNELYLKKTFKPDIIFIDYLNICASSRYKSNFSVNSYSYVKAIAEEIRGLAVEFNVPIVSATQVNRSGFASSDPELTDTSESFGLPATADFMFALISTDELEEIGQILVKQLKNRYNDLTYRKKFVVGIDRAKMRLHDVEDKAQDNILESGKDDDDEVSLDLNTKFKKKFDDFTFS
jgi:replicative DNA helicase